MVVWDDGMGKGQIIDLARSRSSMYPNVLYRVLAPRSEQGDPARGGSGYMPVRFAQGRRGPHVVPHTDANWRLWLRAAILTGPPADRLTCRLSWLNLATCCCSAWYMAWPATMWHTAARASDKRASASVRACAGTPRTPVPRLASHSPSGLLRHMPAFP